MADVVALTGVPVCGIVSAPSAGPALSAVSVRSLVSAPSAVSAARDRASAEVAVVAPVGAAVAVVDVEPTALVVPRS
ncbi:hypothetical protein [Streptacidiphilus sp. PAMC 29251]